MLKWIITMICAVGLTACSSMPNMSSSGYSGQSSASGNNPEDTTRGEMTAVPGALGGGTFGVPGG